jgi:hypothetical protein
MNTEARFNDLLARFNEGLDRIKKDFRKDIHTLARSTGQYMKVVRK